MSILRVHHLNCATFSVLGKRLVTHVLLCETTHDGLVLVDTGIGTSDIEHPRALGPGAKMLRAVLDPAESALSQIRLLGLDPGDVTHILATHLDYDHISGALDFPDALVHLTTAELGDARISSSPRYRPVHLAALHAGRFKDYDGAGTPLLGFSTAYPVAGLDDFWLVPLPGHSAGHAGVAVRAPGGWIFHAGDGFFHHSAVAPDHRPSRRLTLVEKLLADNRSRVEETHARLRRLATDPAIVVAVVCSHDPLLLHRAQSRTAAPTDGAVTKGDTR